MSPSTGHFSVLFFVCSKNVLALMGFANLNSFSDG